MLEDYHVHRINGAAEGGLFNQHLQLLSFLSLGIASGCSELLVEHSPRRKHSVSVPGYIREPLDSLWDVDQLRTYLEGRICRTQAALSA